MTAGIARTGLTVLIAGAGLAALWQAKLPDSRVYPAIWQLTVGCGLAASGLWITMSHRRSVVGWLHLAAGWLLLLAPADAALGHPRAGETVLILVIAGPIPLALLHVVRPQRARKVLQLAQASVVACAALAVAGHAVGNAPLTGLALTIDLVVLICAGWMLFETTTADDRRRLLWLILGLSMSLPPSCLLLVAADEPAPTGTYVAITIVMAVAALALPFTVTVAALNPRWVDVRAVIATVALIVVLLALTTAVYQGGKAAVLAFTGRPAGTAVELLLVVIIAAGFHPTTRWVRGSIQELLFGTRADAVATLTRLGSQLTGESTPAQWLRTLQVALGVPGIQLRQGDQVVACAGRLEETATTAATPLSAGGERIGELVITLPPEQLRLPRSASAVLALVAGPLAQALHATQLADELRASRSQAVSVLEDERRRMRRDLHDGLGPTLTGIAYTADAATNMMKADPGQAQRILRQLRADAADAIAEVRRIVYGLRPQALDELGLLGAIKQRTAHLRNRADQPMLIEINASAQLPDLPAAVEVAAYRITVEALLNVAKHTRTRVATVRIDLVSQRMLRLVIHDDGDGTAGRPWKPGVGLQSMRERAEQIGGAFSIATGAQGTAVTAELPLP